MLKYLWSNGTWALKILSPQLDPVGPSWTGLVPFFRDRNIRNISWSNPRNPSESIQLHYPGPRCTNHLTLGQFDPRPGASHRRTELLLFYKYMTYIWYVRIWYILLHFIYNIVCVYIYICDYIWIHIIYLFTCIWRNRWSSIGSWDHSQTWNLPSHGKGQVTRIRSARAPALLQSFGQVLWCSYSNRWLRRRRWLLELLKMRLIQIEVFFKTRYKRNIQCVYIYTYIYIHSPENWLNGGVWRGKKDW